MSSDLLFLSEWALNNKDLIKKAKFRDSYTGASKWRASSKYRRWKDQVRKRDGHKCTVCGSTDDLTSHHIVPASVCVSLRFEVRNGQTLCKQCHQNHLSHQTKAKFWINLQRTLN